MPSLVVVDTVVVVIYGFSLSRDLRAIQFYEKESLMLRMVTISTVVVEMILVCHVI